MNGHHCDRLKGMLQDQLDDLFHNEDFLKDKWYRSEEAGHNIGKDEAIFHFLNLDIGKEWAKKEREIICGLRCSHRYDCLDAEKYTKKYDPISA